MKLVKEETDRLMTDLADKQGREVRQYWIEATFLGLFTKQIYVSQVLARRLINEEGFQLLVLDGDESFTL